MTKISKKSAYPIKTPVVKDYFVGTDSENNGKTVNFDFEQTAKLINSLNGISIVKYRFMTSENIDLAILTEGDFLSEGNITDVNSISKLYLNKKNFENEDVSELLRFISINRASFLIKMRNSSNLNNAVYFNLIGIVEFQDYFIVNISTQINNSALSTLTPYNIYFFDFELSASDVSDLVIALPEFNKIVTNGGFTSTNNNITFNADWSWLIKTVVYTNPTSITKTITSTTAGYKRIDVFVATTQNTFDTISGVETLGSPVKPSIPVDTIEVTFSIVGDTGIETTEPIDLSDYATKNYVDQKLESSKLGKIQFTANGTDSTFDLQTLAKVKAVFWNGAILDDADWSQTTNILTLTFLPSNGDPIKPI